MNVIEFFVFNDCLARSTAIAAPKPRLAPVNIQHKLESAANILLLINEKTNG
jgi:hypothetical protein